jgi:dienelactone hydrolase
VFADLGAGIGYAEEVGFATIIERGRNAAAALPARIVYVGISLGVLPAQMLAQTRPGALGAVLISAAVPPTEFGGAWPAGVPLQVHMMNADALVVDEGDLAVARGLAEALEGAELHLYEGSEHLFVDESLPDYDAAAAALVTEHVVGLLDAVS